MAEGSPGAIAATTEVTLQRRLPLSAWSWALYEGARTPYVILIKVYIFIPYLATVVIGDAVRGQGIIAQLTMAYGLLAAFTSPLLGAAVDRVGPRKPILAVITALMVILIASLWWALPQGGMSLAAILSVIFVVGLLFAYTEVLHNSLLPFAAPGQTSAASGIGLALGSGIAVLMLVGVLWAFALPARMSLPFLPSQPLFGLSVAAHETDRITALIVAAVFALGSLPLFLFAWDAPRGSAARGRWTDSFVSVARTLKTLPGNRSMAIFLGSRMLYTDGMTAILIFTGLYAAGVMKWGPLELLTLGTIVSVFLSLGGLLATRLDRMFGPKRAIQIELLMVILGQVILLGLGPDRLFYMDFQGGPVWSGPIFRTLPEIIFLVVCCWNALGICGSYASSRAMLTHLSTPDTVGGWFGLYAMSGSVTVWLGSALVGVATALFHTQQAGLVALVGLIVIGLIGLSFIPRRLP